MITAKEAESLRARLRAYDDAQARILELETEIAGLQNRTNDNRVVSQLSVDVQGNSGYAIDFLSKPVLEIHELADALLPVLTQKLALARKELEGL